MTPLLPILLGSILGVDVGWAATPDGNGERVYIIQIEPELLDRLKGGEVITSIIDSRAGPVTKFRIQVGEESLPRVPFKKTSIDAPTTPSVVHSPLPPVPDELVLEIAESPPFVNPGITAPATPAVTGAAEEETFQYNRESTFRVADDTSPEHLSLTTDPESPSAELTNDEIQAAAATTVGENAPGDFVPSPPVRPAIPSEPIPVVVEIDGQDSPDEPLFDVGPATYDEFVDALAIKPGGEPESNESPRPWLPLTLTVLALLASLGGNAYMGYIFVALYRRHRKASNSTGDDGHRDATSG